MAKHQSFLKKPRSAKVTRGLKREARVTKEDANKKIVRLRDKYCRFPMCGCKRFKLSLEASHRVHKGAGGDPKSLRSEPDNMILLCSARHRENSISIHRGTLRIHPLTNDGMGGPCAFSVDVSAYGVSGRWQEVARETALHEFQVATPEQLAVLKQLAEMID